MLTQLVVMPHRFFLKTLYLDKSPQEQVQKSMKGKAMGKMPYLAKELMTDSSMTVIFRMEKMKCRRCLKSPTQMATHHAEVLSQEFFPMRLLIMEALEWSVKIPKLIVIHHQIFLRRLRYLAKPLASSLISTFTNTRRLWRKE